MPLRIKLTKKNEKELIDLTSAVLHSGGIIIYPTDSSYGLGCIPKFKESVKKINRIKKRTKNKPLLVLIDSINSMKKYAEINSTALKLSRKFHPGQLTIIADKKSSIPREVNEKEIAFRIPKNNFCLKLLKKIKEPLISTSLNLSGKKSAYNSIELKKFEGKADLVIDAGNLRKAKPSTLFDSRSNKIIMEGAIQGNKILNFLK